MWQMSLLPSCGTNMSSEDTQIRFRGCTCDEHKSIYQNWPWRDAELTVATCMRTCPYCNKSFLTTSNLRNHLKGRTYKVRQLTVKHERGGRRAIRRAPARPTNPLTNADEQQSRVPGWKIIPMDKTIMGEDRMRDKWCPTPESLVLPTDSSPKVASVCSSHASPSTATQMARLVLITCSTAASKKSNIHYNA
jgi:hypothetical protein